MLLLLVSMKRLNLYHLRTLVSQLNVAFASTEEGNILTEQDEWNKLKLIKQLLIKFGHIGKNAEDGLSLFSRFYEYRKEVS